MKIPDVLVETVYRIMNETGTLPSIREITNRAGVGIGSFYYYFKNSDELLRSVIYDDNVRAMGIVAAQIEAAAVGSIADDVAIFIKAHVEMREHTKWMPAAYVARFLKLRHFRPTVDHFATTARPLFDLVSRRHNRRFLREEEVKQLVGFALMQQSLWAEGVPEFIETWPMQHVFTSYFEFLPRIA